MQIELFAILFAFCHVKCLKINKISNCKTKLDDDSIIDLSPLNNPSNPMYLFKNFIKKLFI